MKMTDKQVQSGPLEDIHGSIAGIALELTGFHNPWRESLENCITGENYLRASEYRELIEELDALYRIRAAGDEKMPVVAWSPELNNKPHLPVNRIGEIFPLVLQSDAQAAILAAYEAGRAENQALIDRLMLEYCPDEMTPKQKANWAKHQRAGKGFDHLLGQEPHHD